VRGLGAPKKRGWELFLTPLLAYKILLAIKIWFVFIKNYELLLKILFYVAINTVVGHGATHNNNVTSGFRKKIILRWDCKPAKHKFLYIYRYCNGNFYETPIQYL
jgi:hypothetical protein